MFMKVLSIIAGAVSGPKSTNAGRSIGMYGLAEMLLRQLGCKDLAGDYKKLRKLKVKEAEAEALKKMSDAAKSVNADNIKHRNARIAAIQERRVLREAAPNDEVAAKKLHELQAQDEQSRQMIEQRVNDALAIVRARGGNVDTPPGHLEKLVQDGKNARLLPPAFVDNPDVPKANTDPVQKKQKKAKKSTDPDGEA